MGSGERSTEKGPMEEAIRNDGVLEIHTVISPPEAAKILGVSRWMVYKHINSGKLQPVLVGGRRCVLRQEVEALASDRRHDDVTLTSG